MPELPEVETTRLGIKAHILNRKITSVIVRQPRLRWPVTSNLQQKVSTQHIHAVKRRGKYILLELDTGHLMIHLGMSGSLKIVTEQEPILKHDHVDWQFDNDLILRFTDPRRFGSIFWFAEPPEEHPLLCQLGPEPLSSEFNGTLLHRASRSRKVAIKNFIMDSHIVVGVGNIYANEALFEAGLRPGRRAGSVSAKSYQRLALAITDILTSAIKSGGTTLKDFVGSDGKPGYFKQSLKVYGRGGEPCPNCGTLLKEVKINQRTTVYCRQCQR